MIDTLLVIGGVVGVITLILIIVYFDGDDWEGDIDD